jgi:hypothetical protein
MTRQSQGIAVFLLFSSLISVTAAAHHSVAARHAAAPPSKDTRGAVEQEVTFTRDIAPILFRSCAPCHRSGEAAPFSLLSFADAKTHAHQIAAVTERRIMPPWLPAADDPKFADDLRLSAGQIALIQTWAEQGAAEGDPSALPAKPKFVEGWQLGKPDVVVKATRP